MFLVDVKHLPGNKIQVYIDGMTNVTIGQCVQISRFLEEYLDKGDIVPVDYNLEVSSPGMENPLVVPAQFQKRIGQNLDVLYIDGRKILGRIKEAFSEGVTLIIEPVSKKKPDKDAVISQTEVFIEYSQIKSATIQFSFKSSNR